MVRRAQVLLPPTPCSWHIPSILYGEYRRQIQNLYKYCDVYYALRLNLKSFIFRVKIFKNSFLILFALYKLMIENRTARFGLDREFLHKN